MPIPRSVPLLACLSFLAAPIIQVAPATAAPTSSIRVAGPDWLSDHGLAGNALLNLVATSKFDGLDPSSYPVDRVKEAFRAGLVGKPAERTVAQHLMSDLFARYASDVARARDDSTLYVDPAARPRPVSKDRLLAVAARAPSLHEFIRKQLWMHPYYGAMREALRDASMAGERKSRLDLLALNLERARVLPRGPGIAVVVNTAAARLEVFEHREVRDSMRVVVGKTAMQTPMMAGLIRYAIVNPYWHVPPDLTRASIAPRVIKEGLGYFRRRGYEVVTKWGEGGEIIPPTEIDWKAVASGKTEVLVRQRPGPGNGMGEVKFMFPNELGIYLHDTPAKQLFKKDERQFSAGCVRLEDAERLKHLLLNGTETDVGEGPEQVIPLPRPAPVYLTYMTVVPRSGRIVELPDVYGRDRKALNAQANFPQHG